MINIIIPCTANYEKKNIINTVNKKIDIVSQFIILCNSIKDNWHFDYRISLFHNKDILFNKSDLTRLSALDIDIYEIKADHNYTPYMLRCNALTHKVKKSGSHRLLLDCDMLAINEPIFDLSCDWQAMYANSVIKPQYYNYINKKYGYDLDLTNKISGRLFNMYLNNTNSKDFFPHFNGGAFLIREKLCEAFKKYTVPSYKIVEEPQLPYMIKHIGVQYGASFALMKISDNWKPFIPGFNYLAKENNIDTFGKDNISLLHYCGVGAYEVANRYFSNEFTKYRIVK